LSPFLVRAAIAISIGLGFGIAAALGYMGMRTRQPGRAATVHR
jgi:hypothetical protein